MNNNKNKIAMGKKDPCAVFWCNNDRLFPEKYTVKDHISNTKLVELIIQNSTTRSNTV